MKRWQIGFVLVALACLALFFTRSTSPQLLKDTDTAVLLTKIRQVQNPFQWFVGDWPLENHFYRPISTLFFEFDNAVHGNNAWGYGLTNVLLVIGCTLALFWFLRELTDNPVIATASTLVFTAWEMNVNLIPWWLITIAIVALTIIGVEKERRLWLLWTALPVVAYALVGESPSLGALVVSIPAWLMLSVLVFAIAPGARTRVLTWSAPPLILYFLATELTQSANLQAIVTGWLPGRTASVMTLFVLISLAAYARYERLGPERPVPAKGPLDPPATKGTVIEKRGIAWPWIVVSLIALALALGSYEQAVMTPALLVAVAVTMKLQRYSVRWIWQAPFWLMLFGYLVLRAELVPREVSQYQNQALRFGPGVWIDLGNYVLPAANAVHGIWLALSAGLFAAVDPRIFMLATETLSNVAVAAKARLHGTLVLAGYGMSCLAFLPMAWLVRFDHYHYLPLAFRSLFVVAVGWVFLGSSATALSPRGLQAPPRSTPAPGSLPRR